MVMEPYKTLLVKPSAFDFIKPGELIDIVEMTPLTLADRRIYNQLIANAWDSIDEEKIHTISKRELRGSHNVSDRVGESIERLMTGMMRIRTSMEGEEVIVRMALLADTIESVRKDGILRYTFPVQLRAVIRESKVFARLRKDVMYALSSKYALTLYEMIQKRGNLKYQWSEEFELERFRLLLGVEKGKLPAFGNFNQKAIQPAVLEVNGLANFCCKIEPVLEGRKVTRVRLTWWHKSEQELKAAYRELKSSKVGRKARLSYKVISTR